MVQKYLEELLHHDVIHKKSRAVKLGLYAT